MAMYLTPTYILGQNWGKPGKPVKGDIFSRENSLRSNYPKLVFGHLHISKAGQKKKEFCQKILEGYFFESEFVTTGYFVY